DWDPGQLAERDGLVGGIVWLAAAESPRLGAPPGPRIPLRHPGSPRVVWQLGPRLAGRSPGTRRAVLAAPGRRAGGRLVLAAGTRRDAVLLDAGVLPPDAQPAQPDRPDGGGLAGLRGGLLPGPGVTDECEHAGGMAVMGGRHAVVGHDYRHAAVRPH